MKSADPALLSAPMADDAWPGGKIAVVPLAGEFRVDQRNTGSQAAVLKLGAVREGLLRAEGITRNGHLRDTAVFSILACERVSA